MSTKIYNGFKVSHNNASKLLKDLKVLQTQFTYQALSELNSKGIDLNIKSWEYEALLQKNKDIEEKIDFYKKELLYANVIIYFKKNMILGQHFIRNRDMINQFINLPWINDWHYQNQTDRPEKLTGKQWKSREKSWDFLNIPSEDGFSFNLIIPDKIDSFWLKCFNRGELTPDMKIIYKKS
jgi:hypothetical protein